MRGYHTGKEGPKKINKEFREKKLAGKATKKDERGQRNGKSQSVGKVRLIKGRNLPEEEGRTEYGSFEA